MESIRIEILNPKAKNILNNLAELNLIRIKKSKVKSGLAELLENLRKNSENPPSLDEISKEVEIVRKARYEKK